MCTTSCFIYDLLYVFIATDLFLVAWKVSIVDLGNKALTFLNDIKLPLILESIFYVIHALSWLVLDTCLVNSIDFTLSNLA